MTDTIVQLVGSLPHPIERLRASKAEYDANLNDVASRFGRQWAARTAEYTQLKWLKNIDLDNAPANPDDKPGVLANWVAEQLDLEPEEIVSEYWEAENRTLPHDDYARFFFAAAAAYFNEVKHQL